MLRFVLVLATTLALLPPVAQAEATPFENTCWEVYNDASEINVRWSYQTGECAPDGAEEGQTCFWLYASPGIRDVGGRPGNARPCLGMH